MHHCGKSNTLWKDCNVIAFSSLTEDLSAFSAFLCDTCILTIARCIEIYREWLFALTSRKIQKHFFFFKSLCKLDKNVELPSYFFICLCPPSVSNTSSTCRLPSALFNLASNSLFLPLLHFRDFPSSRH